jgi:NMD protein affecting ribosome stability and mRNA decay
MAERKILVGIGIEATKTLCGYECPFCAISKEWVDDDGAGEDRQGFCIIYEASLKRHKDTFRFRRCAECIVAERAAGGRGDE